MIPNIHISIDDIIKGANQTEKILWQQIRLLTGENAAIRQIHFAGALVGSEFNTAGVPRRLYLASRLILSHNLQWVNTDITFIINSALTPVALNFRNTTPVWNATAAAIQWNNFPLLLESIEFSSITSAIGGATSQIVFTGYRITY